MRAYSRTASTHLAVGIIGLANEVNLGMLCHGQPKDGLTRLHENRQFVQYFSNHKTAQLFEQAQSMDQKVGWMLS